MASQQPPARPWFRTSSMARPTPAPQAQVQPLVPQPRPAFARPTFRLPIAQPQPTQPQGPYRSPPPVIAAPPAGTVPPPPTATTTTVPTSPIIKTSATSASLPTSPAPKASASSAGLPAVESSSSVPSSPKPKISAPPLPTSPVLKAPISPIHPVTSSSSVPPSPKLEVTAPSSSLPSSPAPPPPSAVPATTHCQYCSCNLTPITFETKQKTVVVQETIGKPKVMPMTSNGDFQRFVSETHISSIGKEGTNGVKSRDKGIYNKFSDSEEEFGMRVITIAGENKGAIMDLSPSNKKYGFGGNPHIIQMKDNPSNEDGKLKMKDNGNKTTLPRMAAFINSNVQGVNNSIIYNCSVTHSDPGVHLSLPTKARGDGHGSHLNDKYI
ncbi:hypothetical protein F0562_004834 [Nyssa sinensis]|uniref:Uncharacterized protein n=1 Tax=Nyssa sinensis TaxID=561372 RepID=A0A5J5AGE6_9ASTE|nr:hypothetical protein F0562_004834 [Nyssa sinensis]